MGIKSFFKNFLDKKTVITNMSRAEYTEDSEDSIMIDTFALFAAIEFASALMANCEIQTYYKGEEKKGKEWVRLNYKPNRNQTASEFWREYFCKLFYEGQALAVEVGENLIIADYFSYEEKAITESYFTQVSRGSFNFSQNFNISDVIFLKYENAGIQEIKNGLLSRYGKVAAGLLKQFETDGIKGALQISAQAAGDKDFEKRYTELMDNRFRSFFKQKNAVIPLWAGMTFTPISGASRYGEGQNRTVSEVTELFSDAMIRAAIALRISPVLIRGEVAGIKEALDLTLTTCVDPIAKMISECLTIKQFSSEEIAAGNHIVVDTTQIKHVDIFDIAANIDKLIASGYYSIDEVRTRAGDQPIGENWSKRHYITKNYQIAANTAEGGEESEEILENAADGAAEESQNG